MVLLIKWMRGVFLLGLFLLSGLPKGVAGTVTFSDQVGNYFGFRNMSEFGANVPPSNLDLPTLITNPHDTIKFRPSAFLTLESNGPVKESSSLASELTFTLQSLGGLAIQELQVSVSGSYATTLFSMPGAEANVGLSLALDLTYGTTVRNMIVPVVKDSSNFSWSGVMTLNQADLNGFFSPPTMEIQQLTIRASPTVSAEALYANARSQINYLDFTVVPVPEPSALHLMLVSLGIGWFRQRSAKMQNIRNQHLKQKILPYECHKTIP